MKTALLVTTALILSACGNAGSGEKVGSVTKLERVGLICKTWEAQLIRGGLVDGGGSFGQAFNFTVPPELVPQVQAALDSQKEVKIHYSRDRFEPCDSESFDNGHYITLQSISTR